MLVIGGGGAALCAAIAARRRGADVLMIDHAPFTWRGGNTRHARNFRIAHEAADDYVPGRYPAAAFAADLARVAPDGDAALAALLAQHSQTLTNWLRAQSVRLQRRGRGVMPWSQRTAFLPAVARRQWIRFMPPRAGSASPSCMTLKPAASNGPAIASPQSRSPIRERW
ncbi:MAG: FAD-binding protein [Rhodopseudomonas palustris]|nr:FAD-binding protein [Rhodopseudomonas palustris]